MSERKSSESSDNQESSAQVQAFEISERQLCFIEEFLSQSKQLREFLDDEEQDFTDKNIQKQNFTEKEVKFIKEWKKQPIEYEKGAPELMEFNEEQQKMIEYWNNELSEEAQDFLREERTDYKKEKFSQNDIFFIQNFIKQSENFKNFLIEEPEDSEEGDDEDGWESEDAFEEDQGLKDLSEKDLEFIEIWKKQSDKLQDFIVQKKKNPSKYNFSQEQLEFIENFKKQSREVKHFVGYEYIELY